MASFVLGAKAALGLGKEFIPRDTSITIENAAKYLIIHDENETMIDLLMGMIYEETMYWAARLFSDVLPAETHDAAIRLVENCDNPEIVSRAKRLLIK